ncbi:aminotransferase class I/II-fold pyridoxal phosphate-dependent enzyme [Acidovorax sp. Leaf84]|uniref:aminotransferase class I/II-fold pyridoxal phosphate-dependent enzyme n=1 Tax=Acidovorax sp. Leaf84 TaxID=1736240 RepID=UPI000AB12AD7|nr:aminotransferase class I/II-fold pyridoxal phosphate-dependent enzyme [Acidovorax sp. Leaf84]
MNAVTPMEIDTAVAALPLHGGPDAGGVPLHDFSTNSNACGPCPQALRSVQAADASRYPDPAYTALRVQLAGLHAVDPGRIVLAGSASEFIHRATAWAARQGATRVAVPAHSYGDYAHAAQAWGLQVLHAAAGGLQAAAGLHWACEPSSPLGQVDPALALWHAHGCGTAVALQVLDFAYAPLRLDGQPTHAPPSAWQLWTPNKALGLTGVRAAYAIAPAHETPGRIAALQGLAPSWPVGAHGVAMLAAWAQPAVQQWLQHSLDTLRGWKSAQQALCTALGWRVVAGSLANYVVAQWPFAHAEQTERVLHGLRAHGIKLRDCSSFGLPGHVRLGVLAPAAQQALARAFHDVQRAAATMPDSPNL